MENYCVDDKISSVIQALLSDPGVQAALAYTEEDAERTLEQQLELACTPAPTFHEEQKTRLFRDMLAHESLESAYTDKTGNVLAPLGASSSPALLLEAHLDSVHPLGTKMDCRREGNILYGPTVRHNSRAVAEILSVLRCIKYSGIKLASTVILGGTVREEGMGAMEGMRSILSENPDIKCCISLDGAINERITYQSTGFETSAVTFRGIGGHAYGSFGKMANPLHAAARAIAIISDIQVPESPKTTFSVSVADSGNDAGVHAIPPYATIKYNLRSTAAEPFEKLCQEVNAAIEKGCRDESERWGRDIITFEKKNMLFTPALSQDIHSTVVQTAYACIKALGREPIFNEGGLANSCIPISMGIPAICLGGEIANFIPGEKIESFDGEGAFKGVQSLLLTVLAMSGVKGVTSPLI